MHVVLGAALLLLLIFIVQGFRHGLVRRAVEIAGLLAVFLFASRLANLLEPRLVHWLHISPKLAFFAAWAAVLIGGVIVVRLLAVALSKLLSISIVGWLDKLGGATLGAAFGCVAVSCLLLVLMASRVDDHLKDQVSHDPITGPLLRVAPAVYDAARGLWGGESFAEIARLRPEPARHKVAPSV